MSRTARVALALVILIAAIIAFIVLKPDDGADKSNTGSETPATTTTTSMHRDRTMPAHVARITARNGAPVGGVSDVTVTKGEKVRLIVRSDAAAELHVHGYNLSKTVPAGGRAVISFPATIDGVFEVELHLHEGKPAQIASLKVQP